MPRSGQGDYGGEGEEMSEQADMEAVNAWGHREAELVGQLAEAQARIATLEAENERLRKELAACVEFFERVEKLQPETHQPTFDAVKLSVHVWLPDLRAALSASPSVCAGCGKPRDHHTPEGLCLEVEYAGGQRWEGSPWEPTTLCASSEPPKENGDGRTLQEQR